MKPMLLLGIVLVVLGVATLGYDHYSYTTTEEVLRIGPIAATAERRHAVALPAILGWLLIGGGACAIGLAALRKKD